MAFNLFGSSAKEPAQSQSSQTKDVTTQTFMQDVIEASKNVPVLVDFWAEWCGPCKQLAPILEKAVAATNGAVQLVKMNIDKDPTVAQQLGVQSIPAVFAFKNGQVVNYFTGAVPESQVRSFIERVAGKEAFSGSELDAAQAALNAGDLQAAAEGFAAALARDSNNEEAIAGLARCYIASGDFDHADQMLALTPPTKQNAAVITSARSALELARKSEASGKVDTSALLAAIESNPTNFQARYDLALALNVKGDQDGALDQLLEIVRRNKSWNEDAARKQLVEFFEAWGADHPLSIAGRQRLSSILFS